MLNTVDVNVRPLLVLPICKDNPEDERRHFVAHMDLDRKAK